MLYKGAIAQTLPSGSVQVQWDGECENIWKVEEGAVWWGAGSTMPGGQDTATWVLVGQHCPGPE